jgi:hypothetical protein
MRVIGAPPEVQNPRLLGKDWKPTKGAEKTSVLFRYSFNIPNFVAGFNLLRFALLITILLLSACGLVDVQVEETLTPELVATPTAFQQSAPAAVVLSYGAEDDDVMVVRSVAYPHIVLSESGATIEPFEQALQPQDYLASAGEFGFRLRTDWRMLWLQDVHGISNVTLEVYVKPPWAEDYESWDYVSTDDREQWGASFENELLDSTLYLPDAGMYGVRAVLTVNARLDDQPDTTHQSTYETQVVVVSKPSDNLPSSVEYFQPAFGELENYGALLDWRSWAFGPCSLSSENQTVTRLMDQACVALEGGDLDAVTVALQQALDEEEGRRTLATIRGQLGVLAAVYGQWNNAARNFREALNLWLVEDDALGVMTGLHNLGASLAFAGRWEEGVSTLQQAEQLQHQMGDWPGVLFTNGQLAVLWQSVEYAQYVADQMSEAGLPQADPLYAWVESMQATPTLEPTE